MKELSLWVAGGWRRKEFPKDNRHWRFPLDVAEDIVQIRRNFPYLRFGFGYYGWHGNPGDEDYPNYFPPQPSFGEAVKRIHEANSFVVPYINGRLWDTGDKNWKKLGVEHAVVRDKNLHSVVETYSNSDAILAVMCPSTHLWKNIFSNLVKKLIQEYQVDGVYIDQLAAAPPVLCFDSSHKHTPGDGEFWVRGYRELLHKARLEMKKVNPETIFLSEGNAEPYIDLIDGFLMGIQYPNDIPLYTAVYGGWTIPFGSRVWKEDIEEEVPFYVKVGESFVNGAQLGWGYLSFLASYARPEMSNFLVSLSRLRYLGRKYFVFGEMVRPPRIVNSIPIIKCKWSIRPTKIGEAERPAVLHSAWRSPENKLGLIMVNISNNKQKVKFQINMHRYRLIGKNYKVFRVDKNNSTLIGSYSSPEFVLRLMLAPRQGSIIEIIPIDEKDNHIIYQEVRNEN